MSGNPDISINTSSNQEVFYFCSDSNSFQRMLGILYKRGLTKTLSFIYNYVTILHTTKHDRNN